ncbi:helix-turn-helix domain-containing protein [Sorangium sp. So ce429]
MELETRAIERELGLSRAQAKALLAALVAEGFVSQDGTFGGRKTEENVYVRTTQGAALAMAKATAPVHRAVARQRLHELIERMRIVNEDPKFLVGIEQAAVFGSYISGAERLGDLDISYKTFRKIDDGNKFVEISQEAARESGRDFSNYVEMLNWPYKHVSLFLKNRSRVYSLGHDDELLNDPTVPRVVIFENRRPILNWQEI